MKYKDKTSIFFSIFEIKILVRRLSYEAEETTADRQTS